MALTSFLNPALNDVKLRSLIHTAVPTNHLRGLPQSSTIPPTTPIAPTHTHNNMASFKSPDWQTTCAYTYRPPNITPGYTGYVPQQRFGYGDTFGNATAERFQARRNELLLSSNVDTEKEYRPPIVKFPTVNSNDPALVLANRKRSQERWLASEKYVRSNERTKERELQEYLKRCQHHREHYSDRTGTVKRVEEFVLPRLIQAKLQENSTGRTVSVNPPPSMVYEEEVKQNIPARNFRGTFRERAIRDQFFETR